jgi:hypothetical protein
LPTDSTSAVLAAMYAMAAVSIVARLQAADGVALLVVGLAGHRRSTQIVANAYTGGSTHGDPIHGSRGRSNRSQRRHLAPI